MCREFWLKDGLPLLYTFPSSFTAFGLELMIKAQDKVMLGCLLEILSLFGSFSCERARTSNVLK